MLYLYLSKAMIIKDVETFGTMDPEVRFTFQDQKVMSKVCHDGGKKPKWDPNEKYEIEIKKKDLAEDILKLEMCNY